MDRPTKNIIKFEDAELPNIPYDAYDGLGNKIRVQTKNPDKHTNFTLQNHPAVFQNLGIVIAQPDRKRRNPSKTEASLAGQQGGDFMVYEKDNYYETIDIPEKHTFQNYTMNVVVFYGHNGDNYTKTYYDTPGGGQC